MSSEKSLTPQIRFKGFTEAWEQRKLGETFCITMGQSPSSANYTSNPDDYVLVQGNADLQNGWVYPRVWTTQVTKSAEPGTLIMSVRAPVGAMGKTAYKIVLGRGVAGIQGPEILFQLFKKYESEGYWIKKSTGSTFDSINGDELKNTLVTLPNISPEQTDIENLLIRLDSLITLHQRKLDALKKIKSALLEKMFPKDGSNIPEIRFTGFTEAWEQRKLGDIATKQTSKNINSTIQEPFTNSAEQGVVSQYDYFDHGITNVANISNYFVICPDDFVYNPRISVTAPCGPINRNRLNRPGIMSPLYTIFRADQCIAVTYLEYYFKTKKWHPFMFLEGNTGARSDRFSISDSTFFKMPIQIPSKAEQKLISEQLEALSNLITLHQRKLDALKKIKSALLEKMFV